MGWWLWPSAIRDIQIDGFFLKKKAFSFIYPGQIPAIALDGPLNLYAHTKYIQLKWYNTCRKEQNIDSIFMFGDIHIETVVWNTLGECLNDSDWITTVLTNADVALSGTSDFFPGCSHFARTRGVHSHARK